MDIALIAIVAARSTWRFRVGTTFSRQWAMPSADTFSVKPIGDFVGRWLPKGSISADPFARNSKLATYRNDLNPQTSARWHMQAVDFLIMLADCGVEVDVLILDPPYSPRQITECYAASGLKASMQDTQSARLYRRVRDAGDALLKPGGVVLSFGWNTVGMGKSRGYSLAEVMLVCHGGAHNDTICLAERKS